LTREGLKIDTVVKMVQQIAEANAELDEIEDRIARMEVKQQNIDNMVTRFYRLCLGRKPDQDGLTGWARALWDGASTGSDVAYGFVFSPEFLQQKTTNEQYLAILYNAFFDRPPDPAGLQGWLDALSNGSSREQVLNGFIYASEFAELCDRYGIKPFEGYMTKSQKEAAVQAFVARFYRHCLDRNPDTPGLEGWQNSLLNHFQTGADVAHGFMGSSEFLAKNTTNEEYLTILYKAFFDRDPDQEGWDAWLAELDSGKERNYVLDGFLHSQEFAGLCRVYDINPY
jgi:hypothetical protein